MESVNSEHHRNSIQIRFDMRGPSISPENLEKNKELLDVNGLQLVEDRNKGKKIFCINLFVYFIVIKYSLTILNEIIV